MRKKILRKWCSVLLADFAKIGQFSASWHCQSASTFPFCFADFEMFLSPPNYPPKKVFFLLHKKNTKVRKFITDTYIYICYLGTKERRKECINLNFYIKNKTQETALKNITHNDFQSTPKFMALSWEVLSQLPKLPDYMPFTWGLRHSRHLLTEVCIFVSAVNRCIVCLSYCFLKFKYLWD